MPGNASHNRYPRLTGAPLKLPSTTNVSLIESARRRDHQAIESLVDLYGDYVLHWLRRFDNLNEEDRQDLRQTILFTIVNKLDQFEPRRHQGQFRSWVKTIVRNSALDFLKSAQHSPQQISSKQWEVVEYEMRDDSQEYEISGFREVVRRALAMIAQEFKPKTFEMARLAWEGERTVKEIAEEFEVTEGNVRQAKARVGKRLRELTGELQEYETP